MKRSLMTAAAVAGLLAPPLAMAQDSPPAAPASCRKIYHPSFPNYRFTAAIGSADTLFLSSVSATKLGYINALTRYVVSGKQVRKTLHHEMDSMAATRMVRLAGSGELLTITASHFMRWNGATMTMVENGPITVDPAVAAPGVLYREWMGAGALPNGMVALCGWASVDRLTPEGTQDLDVVVAMMDPQTGVVQWERRFGGERLDIGQNITVLQNGSFVVVADSRSVNVDRSIDMMLIRMNQNGTVIWTASAGDAFENGTQGVVELPDRDLLVFGESTTSIGKFDFPFARFSRFGELKRYSTIQLPGADAMFAAAVLDDSTVVGTGYSNSYDPSAPTVPFICGLSFDGELRWIHYATEDVSALSQATAIHVFEDRTVAYAGLINTEFGGEGFLGLCTVGPTVGVATPTDGTSDDIRPYPLPAGDMIRLSSASAADYMTIRSLDGRELHTVYHSAEMILPAWLTTGTYALEYALNGRPPRRHLIPVVR